MSRKTPPTDPNQGFGDLDDWFNEAPAAGFDEPDAAEDASKAAAQKAEEARAAEAKKAEEARAAEAKKADEKRKLEEAKQREEDARQAQLEADARRAARAMQDQATRVYKRKSKAEILAEEDAADALVEPARAEAEVAGPAPADAPRTSAVSSATVVPEPDPEPAAEVAVEPPAESSIESSGNATDPEVAALPVSETAPLPDQDAPTVAVSEAEAAAASGSLPAGMSILPVVTNEDAMETEVVDVPAVASTPEEAAVEQVAAAAHLAWTPPADERTAWIDVVDTLGAAAAASSGETAALLYGAAAHLARTRAVDLDRAKTFLDAAGTAARPRDPAWWRDRVAVALSVGDGDAARFGFETLAELTTGPAAAEAMVQAARVVRDQLGQEALARAELAKNRAKYPEEPGLLVVLRELGRAAADPDIELAALDGLARLQVASVAAQVHLERADILERKLGRVADAIVATEEARAADGENGAVFLALERRYKSQGAWAPLAQLYRDEGTRLATQAKGADAAWWLARAGRLHRVQLLDEKGAGACYRAAVGAAPEAADVRHEYHAWCEEAQAWDELAASMAEEIGHAPAEARSFLEYRRGLVLESRLSRTDEALACFRAASDDPAAAPAAESVLRVLQARGAWSELVGFLETRLSRLTDPGLMVTVLYRMGETCEGPLGDQATARKHYERVLDVAPGYLPALEGLERVYTRLSAWAELAAIYEQRAILAEEPAAVALQRHRAGAVYEFRLGQEPRGLEQYLLALSSQPDFAPSLDAYTRAMEAKGNWAELARVLRGAAIATRDSNEAVSLAYRAARVLADRTDDLSGAVSCLQKCLEVSPGFLPAVLLNKELAARQGDWSQYHRLERGQAEMSEDVARRHWRLYAAAEAAQRLPDADPSQLAREVLREDAAHPGAVAISERMAWSAGEPESLVELFLKRAAVTRDEAERVRCFVRVAELSSDALTGDGSASENLLRGLSEVLGATAVAGRPLWALARVAEATSYPEEALRALQEAGAGESLDAARLRQNALGDAEGAARLLVRAMDNGTSPEAAASLLKVARDPAARALAHGALANTALNPGIRSVHAAEAALLHESLGDQDAALAAWWMAFEADPHAGRALDGLRAALVRARDADGLRRAYGLLGNTVALGDALEEAGDLAGAVAEWRLQEAVSPIPLAWKLRIERGLEGLGDWQGLLAALRERLADASGELADKLAGRVRWVLAEKLAESDEAWTTYRELHASRPGDTEVLEALARIAAARGEQALAGQYLEELAKKSTTPADAARVQRRRAELLERAGDTEGARNALARALDHVPDDIEALGGLRRLAAAAADWQAVVGVLAQEAALCTGRAKTDKFAEIARTWEERLGDRGVAIDAWRKVLDLAANDKDALAHLSTLTEAVGDWSGFVDHGRAYLAFTEGKDRTALLRRLGDACAQHLRREDDALGFYEKATTGPNADSAAFAGMERLLAGRGDNPRLVELLVRRAKVAGSPAEKADALARAARIRVDVMHDKAAAAAIYDDLLAIVPDHADALGFRADFAFEAGDFAAAAELFRRMEPTEIARDHDDLDEAIEGATFFFRFGEALRRSGDPVGAIQRYSRALELNPTHLPSLDAVAPLHMAAKDWGAAEKVLKQVMQLTGGMGNTETLARTYARLGITEFHLGHLDRARKRISKAIELRNNDVEALKGLALVMASQGDWSNLLNVYNNIIYHTHEPSDVTGSYLAKGLVLDQHMKMPDKAGQHYEKSLAFDASQPVALVRLAELALRRQDWPEAAGFADRGLALEGVRADVTAALHLVRAVACQACGDAVAAKESFNAAVAADVSWQSSIGPGGVEDYDKVHEAIRARVAQGQL